MGIDGYIDLLLFLLFSKRPGAAFGLWDCCGVRFAALLHHLSKFNTEVVHHLITHRKLPRQREREISPRVVAAFPYKKWSLEAQCIERRTCNASTSSFVKLRSMWRYMMR